MRYCLITFFDKDIESFSTIQAINAPSWHDLKVDLVRGLKKQFPLDKLGQFAGKILHFKGTFNDETGVLEPAEGVDTLDCDSILIGRTDYYESVKKSAELIKTEEKNV